MEIDGMRIYTSDELSRMWFRNKPVSSPENPYAPYGEWYCTDEDCIVREVRIIYKPERLPVDVAFSCPCCDGPLKFHHFIEQQTVVFPKGMS